MKMIYLSKYFTKGTLYINTSEHAKLGVNSFPNLGLIKEEVDKKGDELFKQMKDDEDKDLKSAKDDTDSDNNLVQWIKMLNKDIGKKEIVDKIVKKLTDLAWFNFSDKNLLNEYRFNIFKWRSRWSKRFNEFSFIK